MLKRLALKLRQNLTLGTLYYSSYFGRNGDDGISAVTVDSAGNTYFTGSSFPSNKLVAFPSGTYVVSDVDVVVYKLDPFGGFFLGYYGGASRERGTALGQDPTRGDDIGQAIATDNNGHVFITGYTRIGV